MEWDEVGLVAHLGDLEKQLLAAEIAELQATKVTADPESWRLRRDAIQLRLFRRRLHRQLSAAVFEDPSRVAGAVAWLGWRCGWSSGGGVVGSGRGRGAGAGGASTSGPAVAALAW